MTDDNQEDEMPKSNVTKLPEGQSWLAPVLAEANVAIDKAGGEIAAGVAQDASDNRSQDGVPAPTFDGHTRGSGALVEANRIILESEIDNINEEIRLTTDESAYLVRVIEANRDDKLARLVAKRDNALRSAEALQAMQRVLAK